MNSRFKSDANTFEEVVEYFTKRAIQLLKNGFTMYKILELPEGAMAYFLKNGKKMYRALYLYKDACGKGNYKRIMGSTDTHLPILTSDDCGIEEYLRKNNYEYRCIRTYSEEYYNYISQLYGAKKAERSGVDYMNHIDEGLAIFNMLGIDDYYTKVAYALHPVVQSDADLLSFYQTTLISNTFISEEALLLMMEYRSVANEYLSKRDITSIEEIRLSPLKAVNDMLIADKIQNRKDFELYHQEHPRFKELDQYFKNWLQRLGISEDKYQEIKRALIIEPKVYKYRVENKPFII